MRKYLLFTFILFYSFSFSQFIVKGKVSDKLTKEELIGANIVWKQQNLGVSTDINGEFEITIPSNKFPIELTISYMGYSTQKITIKKDDGIKIRGFINLRLVEISKTLTFISSILRIIRPCFMLILNKKNLFLLRA